MRSVLLTTLAVAAVVLSSGCSHLVQWKNNGHKVGPDHVAPTAPVAEHWIDYNNAKLISTQHGACDENWWQTFNDPAIEKIVAAANDNYLPLRVAMLRIQESRLQRAIAVGNLFPQSQEFFAEFQRIQNSDNGNQIGIADLGQTFDFYQFGFNASWELDLWGRLRRQIESEDAKLGGAIEDSRDVRLSLVSDAISAYIEIRTHQDRLVFAHANIKAQQKTLDLAQLRFKNGSVSKLDVTQAEANLEATRAAIPELERDLRVANNQLCVLLGLTPRDLITELGWAAVPAAPEAVLVGMPVDLLRRRPDIRSAERAIAAQSALIGVAAADLFPTFSLRGTINWQSFNFPDLFESAANAGAIIPGVRWNILNYGRLANNVSLQETRLERSITEYRQTVLKAGGEVENALTRFIKAQQQIVSRQRAVNATAESIEIASLQYEEGVIEFDRVNNLRKDLVRQQDLLALARGEAAQGIVAIYRTLGGGWAAAGTPEDSCASVTDPLTPTIASDHGASSSVASAPKESSSATSALRSPTPNVSVTQNPIPTISAAVPSATEIPELPPLRLNPPQTTNQPPSAAVRSISNRMPANSHIYQPVGHSSSSRHRAALGMPQIGVLQIGTRANRTISNGR